VPALIRWVPEAQFPYPIGYDTPHYLAAGMVYAESLHPFPLLYFVLARLYNIGVDPIYSMKVLPTILYGLFGFSTFLLAKRQFRWSNWKSLLLVFFVAFSPAMLRGSWDLNKQMLALVLFVSSLCLLDGLRRTVNIVFFVGFSVLVAMSHELVYGLMAAVQILLLLLNLLPLFKRESVDIAKISKRM